MKAFQFIYTKLPPEESPWRKCLTAGHGYSIRELKALGFPAAEVERFAARAHKGLLIRLKGLFKG